MKRNLLYGFAAAAVAAFLGFQAGQPKHAWAIGTPRLVDESLIRPLKAGEPEKIEAYLRAVLANPGIRVVRMPPDAEVWLGEHFLGIVFADESREGRSFFFEMVMYEEEVDEAPPRIRAR